MNGSLIQCFLFLACTLSDTPKINKHTFSKKRLSQINFEMAFFVSTKKWASPNFSQPELARFPNFLYLREPS